jgi:cellobiose-specific phosphotransferase system component IIC
MNSSSIFLMCRNIIKLKVCRCYVLSKSITPQQNLRVWRLTMSLTLNIIKCTFTWGWVSEWVLHNKWELQCCGTVALALFALLFCVTYRQRKHKYGAYSLNTRRENFTSVETWSNNNIANTTMFVCFCNLGH